MIHDDVDQVSAIQLLETMNLNLHGIVRAHLYILPVFRNPGITEYCKPPSICDIYK